MGKYGSQIGLPTTYSGYDSNKLKSAGAVLGEEGLSGRNYWYIFNPKDGKFYKAKTDLLSNMVSTDSWEVATTLPSLVWKLFHKSGNLIITFRGQQYATTDKGTYVKSSDGYLYNGNGQKYKFNNGIFTTVNNYVYTDPSGGKHTAEEMKKNGFVQDPVSKKWYVADPDYPSLFAEVDHDDGKTFYYKDPNTGQFALVPDDQTKSTTSSKSTSTSATVRSKTGSTSHPSYNGVSYEEALRRQLLMHDAGIALKGENEGVDGKWQSSSIAGWQTYLQTHNEDGTSKTTTDSGSDTEKAAAEAAAATVSKAEGQQINGEEMLARRHALGFGRTDTFNKLAQFYLTDPSAILWDKYSTGDLRRMWHGINSNRVARQYSAYNSPEGRAAFYTGKVYTPGSKAASSATPVTASTVNTGSAPATSTAAVTPEAATTTSNLWLVTPSWMTTTSTPAKKNGGIITYDTYTK